MYRLISKGVMRRKVDRQAPQTREQEPCVPVCMCLLALKTLLSMGSSSPQSSWYGVLIIACWVRGRALALIASDIHQDLTRHFRHNLWPRDWIWSPNKLTYSNAAGCVVREQGPKEVQGLIAQGLGALLGPRSCSGSCCGGLQASLWERRQVDHAALLCRPHPLVPEGPDCPLACGFIPRWDGGS